MKLKIKKNSILIFILILPFIFPEAMNRINGIPFFLKVWKIIDGIIAIVYLMANKKFSLIFIVLLLFYLTFSLSSIIHGMLPLNWLEDLFFLSIVYLLTEKKDVRESFYNVVTNILFVIIFINFCTMLLFQNGLYTTNYELNWFLGFKNGLIRKILPYITLILIKSKNRKKTVIEKIGITISIASLFMSKSLNCILGIIVFLFLYFICFKSKVNICKLKMSTIFILYIIIDVIVINSNLIIDVLNKFTSIHKNASILGRINIWNVSLELIEKSPVIGYGNIESDFYNLLFNVSHPHNLLLYYLMIGGIIGIAFFMLSLKILDKCRAKKEKYESQIFIIFYIVLFITGLTESLIGTTFFIPFLVLWYNILQEKNNMKGEKNDRYLYSIQN